MKKYQIIWAKKDGKTREIIGSAASKAPNDVTIIARECGYNAKYVFNSNLKNKTLSVLINFCNLIKALGQCEKGSTILLQYPCFNENIFQFARFFFPKRKYITVVHDINSIRLKGKISKAEISSLSIFNEIIVHSPEMKDYLSKYLQTNIKYHILGCFPYLTESVCKKSEVLNEVCFAGNIDKSIFLKDFIPHIKNIKLKLYGKMEHQIPKNSKVEYCGMFNPNDISSLSGSWGLVWDGNSIETCSGTWGEYLRIIAPHKFSLYIAAGIPVIVWDKSAMARIVKEKGIGIIITNLYDLEKKISSVSNIQYIDILKSIAILQKKLKDGENLKSLI